MSSLVRSHNFTFKLHFLVFASFIFFLLALPQFNGILVPCLKYQAGMAYDDKACNLNLALNNYLLLALLGFTACLFIIYLRKRLIHMTSFLVTAVLLALSIIVSFHLYIPQAEKIISKSSIYLDSIK